LAVQVEDVVMRVRVFIFAMLSVPAVLWAHEATSEENAVRAEQANAARYALRPLHVDLEKYALKAESSEMKSYPLRDAVGMDEFEKADQATVNEVARLVSKDGKNPEQADFEYAVKLQFGADADIHEKMSSLKVGPYAEPDEKTIVGRKGAAVEWARNHRWAEAPPKFARNEYVANVPVKGSRAFNPGGVQYGYLPEDRVYETSAAWNARKARKTD